MRVWGGGRYPGGRGTSESYPLGCIPPSGKHTAPGYLPPLHREQNDRPLRKHYHPAGGNSEIYLNFFSYEINYERMYHMIHPHDTMTIVTNLVTCLLTQMSSTAVQLLLTRHTAGNVRQVTGDVAPSLQNQNTKFR